MADQSQVADILAEERKALDRWSSGDVVGYLEHFLDEATYVDNVGAEPPRSGLAAVRAYFAAAFKGRVPPHRSSLATVIYRRSAVGWRVVHNHWAVVPAGGTGVRG